MYDPGEENSVEVKKGELKRTVNEERLVSRVNGRKHLYGEHEMCQ